jgi:predicted branched-subunit amino acid permease
MTTTDNEPSIAVHTPRRRHSAIALDGARDITPMVVGVVPFALAIGAAIGTSTLTSAEGLASGPAILAGSAQLATIQMIDAGAAPIVIILSAVVINARLLLYSASLAPWFAGQRLSTRLLLALPVIDQMYFTCGPRFERRDLDERGRIAYYVGAATWLIGAWVSAQAAAVVLGAQAPAALGLDIAAPLAMVGLLARSTSGRPARAAAVAGFTIAVVAVGLPLHSAVLVASICGIAAGWTVQPGGSRHSGTAEVAS